MLSEKNQFELKWSSSLEILARDLLQDILAFQGSAFDKITIAVNDAFAENWLKQYFLRHSAGRVLMNLEFVALPELINDWLAAQLHDVAPDQREADIHPYSPRVLVWRIYRILENFSGKGEFKELTDYVGNGPDSAGRRYALAGQLAKLYDDYQNRRFQLLRNWEKHFDPASGRIPVWESALYRELATEDPASYAWDFERAFDEKCDFRISARRHFGRCRKIHVFDISFMPDPSLRLLEKISEAVPVVFWMFNPHSKWLGDTPSKKEAIQAQRRALQNGELPDAFPLWELEEIYHDPEEKLFDIFASGIRSMINLLCDDVGGNVQCLDDTEALEELKRLGGSVDGAISIHRGYSPRRELETIRNELLDFFQKNPDARPGDVVVLCADWENYAPVIESVFLADGSGGNIPITIAGKIAGETPFGQVFQELLSFAENRLEISAVFNLLRFPQIGGKFSLDAVAVDALRRMVQQANIHWGFDDEDVRRTLQIDEPAEQPYPFTWQRGFDRMISEMLGGFNETDDALRQIGKLGVLHPCGSVEGDRARYVASLWQFVQLLHRFGEFFREKAVRRVDEMTSALSDLLDLCFDLDDVAEREVRKIRNEIFSIAGAMRVAGIGEIVPRVFLVAVKSALSGRVSLTRPMYDAVTFAPLNTSTAMPHELVWVCGLNDGSFPKIEHRFAYDVIGEHPSALDVNTRDREAFALLKALLGAKKRLAFSFIGKDVRTNDDVPPSILLSELKDYFKKAQIPVKSYEHPMHAYSARYFYQTGDADLPTSYSAADKEIAKCLQRRRAGEFLPEPSYTAFSLASDGAVTTILLDDLADYFADPRGFLYRSKGIRSDDVRYERLFDKEAFALDPRCRRRLEKEFALKGAIDEEIVATVLYEEGMAPDAATALAEIERIKAEDSFSRTLRFSKDNSAYNCEFCTLAELYGKFQKAQQNAQEKFLDLPLGEKEDGALVRLVMHDRPVEQSTSGDPQRKFLVFFAGRDILDADKRRCWIHHLAANAVESGNVATLLFGCQERRSPLFTELPAPDAQAKLAAAVRAALTPLPESMLDGGDPEIWQPFLWEKCDLIQTLQARAKS